MYYSPASSDSVITVGASTFTDTRAWFSNKGSLVDLYAPGVFINSASNLNRTVCRNIALLFFIN
jgi:subtilisin family serine protease